jgi:hypothetical protein
MIAADDPRIAYVNGDFVPLVDAKDLGSRPGISLCRWRL